MLKVHGGRFPQDMKDPMSFGLVSWATDERQVKSRNVPFSLSLTLDEGERKGQFSMTFQHKDSDKWHTVGGECHVNEDTGIIRLDTEEALDFWMELKRV